MANVTRERDALIEWARGRAAQGRKNEADWRASWASDTRITGDDDLRIAESWAAQAQRFEQVAAALAAPPPDETRGEVAMLDEMIELAESNVERAQRLRDNPEFVQGDRVSYAVQAGVWGSLAETLKTRRAGFPPAAQAPPPDPPGQDDVTFWQMVADGVNHDPRCPNHFAGDPKGQPCMRCQLEAARQSDPPGLTVINEDDGGVSIDFDWANDRVVSLTFEAQGNVFSAVVPGFTGAGSLSSPLPEPVLTALRTEAKVAVRQSAPLGLVALVKQIQQADADGERALLDGDMFAATVATSRFDCGVDKLLAYDLAALPAPPDPPGMDAQALARLRNRVEAIREEATQANRRRDFDIGWQLSRLADEIAVLETLARPVARQSAPPGLASLARSLAEALWDMQSAPDCWCPPDRSCTDGHTEACTAARAVNGAAKRFHLYNESPLPARHSDPPGLLAKLRERVKAWRAMASLLDKDDYPCGIELSDSLDECADQIDEMLAALPATDPQVCHHVVGRVDHGDDEVTTACGLTLQTWAAPVRNGVATFDRTQATCPKCLATDPQEAR